MKYFVSGATGFIGGRLAEKLIQEGHQISALVRSPSKAKHLADMGITLLEGDITDKDSMRAGMSGVDGVYHIAAWYKVGVKDQRAEEINVEGTRNVLELMKELKIKKGVYTSSLAVFSDTHGVVADENYYFDGDKEAFASEYDRTKWLAHYKVALPMMKAGLPLVIVQPGLVYGPGDVSSLADSLKQYLRGRLPMVPQGSTYAWAHVDDVVRGHILAMEKGKAGETYIISGEILTLIEGLKIAEEITGIPVPRLKASPALLKFGAQVMGLLSPFIKLPEQYHPEMLRTIAGTTYIGDNSKARRELGYNPRPLREGLPETLTALMKEAGVTARKLRTS